MVERARALFTPADPDLRTVTRTLSILGHDAIAAAHGPTLLARAATEAPGIRLRFLNESHLDAPFLREGSADLEVGVIDSTAPEVHTELLTQDRMMGVARAGHPLLEGELTPERFALDADHITASRRGKLNGPVDTALAELGLKRRVVATVGSLPSSLFILRDTDLIGLNTTWGFPWPTPSAWSTSKSPCPYRR